MGYSLISNIHVHTHHNKTTQEKISIKMSDISTAQKFATVCAILAACFTIFQCGQDAYLDNINAALFNSNLATKYIVMFIFAPIAIGFAAIFALASALANGGKMGVCVGILGFLAFSTMAVHMGLVTEMAVAAKSYSWRFGMGWAAVLFSLIGTILSFSASKGDSYDY